MSLLVRLPLNGNLNNYGSADVTVTNNGATISDNGKLGKCYAFDGTNDKIQISNPPTPTDITVAMWFKRNTTTNTRQFLYTQWSGITLELDTANKITCSVNTSKGQTGYCRTDTTITANSGWTHIVFSFKNGTGTSLYINGEFVTSASLTDPIIWGSGVVGNIGYFSTYFNGCVNDFRIYDHCLSESEIKHLIRGKGLQLWMPLTKDLRQQGLSNVTVTNNGATFNSAGKLGGCYSFNNSAIGIGATNITLGNTFSIACWIKVNSYNSNWANAFKIYKDGYDYIGLCMNQTSASTKQLGFHIYKNNGSNDRTRVYDAYYMPLTVGTWYHLCFVVTPSEVKTYQNGVNIRTGSITTTFPSVSNYNLGLGKSSSFGGLDCSMNDFRLYDHALSEKEVKELSKGLVLHYPLNRGGLGQENIIPNSKIDGSWTYPSSSYSDKYATITTVIPSDTQYTLSFDAKSTVNGDKMRTHYYSPNTTTTCVSSQGITKTAADGNMDFTLSTQWQRYWVTYTQTETTAVKHLICPRLVSGQGSGTVSVKNVKLEEGSIATPWCPNSSDALATTMGINGTTEYDCSGFCNNGARTGTFTWTSDTPKYQVSTHIGATNQKIHISNFPTSGFGDSYSFAWWGKRNSNSPMFWGFSDGIRLNGMYGGTLWNTGDSSNNPIYKPGTTTKITAPSIDVWHHYVMTGDGTTCKLYLDGELYGQAKTYKAISGTSIWINGWDSGTQYCSDNTDISDFRIYATALSSDDIAELYNGGVL